MALAPGKQSTLHNLLLGLAVSLLFLGGAEGVCRVLERQRPAPRPARPHDSERWGPARFMSWEEWDGGFYTRASKGPWPPDPELSPDGMRDRPHPVGKPAGTWRLVCLGDSVTYGYGVRAGQAYPQALEAKADTLGIDLETFNVALPAWSTRQEAIAYRRIVRRYRPDQVLLGICLNDIPEMQNNLSRPPDLLAGLYQRSALVRRIVDAEGREIRGVQALFLEKESPQVREGFERFFAELRSLRGEIQADGGTLSLVVFPYRFQLAPDAPPPKVQEAVAAFAKAEGIRCVDALPALRRLGDGAFIDYCHLSPQGAERVAAEILGSGILPERPTARQVLFTWLATRGSAGNERWIEALREGDPTVRAAATWALRRAGPGASPAVTALVEALGAGEARVRAGAARALAGMGGPARTAGPALLLALEDPQEDVRWRAAEALWALGPSRESIPALVGVLGSRDEYVSAFAAESLRALGPEAVPALVAALGGADAERCSRAATVLGHIGPPARSAVPALAAVLAGGTPAGRVPAARALGRIGPDARDAIPALLGSLEDADPALRRVAEQALARIRTR